MRKESHLNELQSGDLQFGAVRASNALFAFWHDLDGSVRWGNNKSYTILINNTCLDRFKLWSKQRSIVVQQPTPDCRLQLNVHFSLNW